VESNGTLRLYDPISDGFVLSRPGAVTGGLRGTVSAAADGSSYVVDNSVFNNVLTLKGAIATTAPAISIPGIPGLPAAQSGLAFGDIMTSNSVVRVQAGSAAAPTQSLQRFNLTTLQSDLQVSLPEPVMDITPAAVANPAGTRQWPPFNTAL